jgi:hypothetical protein
VEPGIFPDSVALCSVTRNLRIAVRSPRSADVASFPTCFAARWERRPAGGFRFPDDFQWRADGALRA